jgi:aerobic carbon-monoxide dehydrogenase medium subunit
MFPAPFEYHAALSLDDALGALAEHGDDAKVMAGGQSLIPLLKLRLAAPEVVVDLARVPDLNRIAVAGSEVRIGARCRHVDIERDPTLRQYFPILSETASQIADPLVRNMGTIGGSICHADPQGDWGSVMLALGAHLVARSASGERVVPVAGFFDGPFTTRLRADEILTEIRLPVPTGPSAGTYLKLERKVGDFATVGVAVQVELDDGAIARAGIALTAVGATNLQATAAEEALAGREPTDQAIAEAAAAAAAAAEPRDDNRGSAAYKRDVVRVYVQRGVKAAVSRAREAQA